MSLRLISMPALPLAAVCVLCASEPGRAELPDQALDAAKHATSFLTEQVSTHGGYLWRYSADLQRREGEGVVDTETVWVQPPGTPSVGESFLRLYEATGDPQFLDAARAAGEALRLGRCVPVAGKRWWNSNPNDAGNGPTAPIRHERKPKINPAWMTTRPNRPCDSSCSWIGLWISTIKACTRWLSTRLEGLLDRGQLPNGGFPQVWTSEKVEPSVTPRQRAGYPDSWSRVYPGHQQYWQQFTLNDNLAPDVLRTLFLAHEIYHASDASPDKPSRYLAAALKLADSLLLAQMPDPQPAWAQQYNVAMQPMWARKFEPPAICGGESQGIIEALLFVSSRTGDRKYLAPLSKALDYLDASELPNGRLARFYELRTNRPLYFTQDYVLTYDGTDAPTHYSFEVPSRIDRLRREFSQLMAQPNERSSSLPAHRRSVSDAAVRSVLAELDDRGAWITDDGLRYHKKPGPVIDMRIAVQNLNLLADYLAEQRDSKAAVPPGVTLPQMWEVSPPLIAPERRQNQPSHAQKDPTIVFHDNRWHVFMTVKLPDRSAIEYCSFADWRDADASARTILRVSDSAYYCAPQVFFFQPHNKWYLIYQMGVPGQDKMWVAYSTTESIADPATWTQAQPILDGGPDDHRTVGGLDYWIICDDQRRSCFSPASMETCGGCRRISPAFRSGLTTASSH